MMVSQYDKRSFIILNKLPNNKKFIIALFDRQQGMFYKIKSGDLKLEQSLIGRSIPVGDRFPGFRKIEFFKRWAVFIVAFGAYSGDEIRNIIAIMVLFFMLAITSIWIRKFGIFDVK
jgi:hypothetical protein